MSREIHLVWVQDQAELIGVHQSIPWKILDWEDEVKELVATRSVIVGRQAYISRYHKLKVFRRLLVLTSTSRGILEGHESIETPSQALQALKDDPVIYVLGGCRTLKSFYPYATHLHITEVRESDVTEIDYRDKSACYSPEIDFNQWTRLARRGFKETDEGVVYTSYLYRKTQR